MGGELPTASIEVTAERLRSKLDAACQELKHLLVRSAYSTLLRETRDCSIVLLGPNGEAVVDGLDRSVFIQNLLARFEPTEGDIFICNHPFQSGVQHTNDLVVTVPVFVDGRRIGFSCSVAHKSDVGGAVVGSASSSSTELLQEGLLLPIMRAGNGDSFSEHITAIIEANTRDPDLFIGDMRAQIGVTKVGVERLKALAQTAGVDEYLAGCDLILDQTERQVRSLIAKLPDGSAHCVAFLDHDGVNRDQPVRYEFVITVAGDQITFDGRRSDDQRRGPINYSRPMAERSVHWALLAAIDVEQSIVPNEGMHRAVQVVLRDGSVLAAQFPAPVGASTIVMHTLHDTLMEGLAELAPETSIASGGGSGTMAILYRGMAGGAGSRAMQYEIIGSGNGGSRGQDGCSGVLPHRANFHVTPIEVLEAQFPVRIRRFELLPDTAGAGQWRGGLGFRREYECLCTADVNRRADREKFPGKGVQGGLPGALGAQWIQRASGQREQVPMAGQYQLGAGDRLIIETGGAGGWGNPLKRAVEAVAQDVRNGYVSRGAAAELYGAVVGEDGTVDASATATRRAEPAEPERRKADEAEAAEV